MSVLASTGESAYYFVFTPLSVAVAILGVWLAGRGERRERGRIERERADRESRMHAAMYGYVEGGTTVPGVYQVVVGLPGQDSLGKVAREARDTANTIAEKQTKIEGDVDHIGNLAEAAAVMSSDAKDSGEAIVTRLIRVEEAAAIAATKAETAATATSKAVDTIQSHINEDLSVHEEQRIALNAIGKKVGAPVDLPEPSVVSTKRPRTRRRPS